MFEIVAPAAGSQDGAALVQLVGSVGRLRAPDAHTLLTKRRGDTTWVLVVLETPGVVSFSALLRRAGAPAARVLQVADGSNVLRQVSGYRVEIRR